MTTSDRESVFKLAPPDIDEGKIAPALRKEVRALRDLSPSHKVIFDLLTENQFHYPFRVDCGIVRMTKVAIARACALGPSTVLEAAREFEKRNLVFTKTYWEGIGEMTYWYIRGLAQKHELKAAYDECTGRMLRLAKRPPRTRDGAGKFVSGNVEKPAIFHQNRLPYGVKHPSARSRATTGTEQSNVTDGVEQRQGSGSTPRRRSTQSTPMADSVHADGSGLPQSKNVSKATLTLRRGEPAKTALQTADPASPPPSFGKGENMEKDPDLRRWLAEQRRSFDTNRRKRREELVKQLLEAPEDRVPVITWKIQRLHELLDLPPFKAAEPKRKRSPVCAAIPTAEERAKQAEVVALESGKFHLEQRNYDALTIVHVTALRAAGLTVPEAVIRRLERTA